MLRIFTTILSVLLVSVASAKATTITYSLTPLGGDDYSVEFSITNDTLGIPIEEFTIYFPLGGYENIAIDASPTDWDGLAIEPDAGIPDDGFADWLALGDPIGVGETLSGFVALFTFIGSGEPGGFLFDIVDAVTFEALDSGVATLAGDMPSEIPLPGAFVLFVAGLAGLVGVQRRRSFA